MPPEPVISTDPLRVPPPANVGETPADRPPTVTLLLANEPVTRNVPPLIFVGPV